MTPDISFQIITQVTLRALDERTAVAVAQARIEQVAQRIADQVDTDHQQQDHQPRQHGDPWIGGQELPALAEHRAEVSVRWLRPQAEKAQARGLQHHPAERGGHQQQQRWNQIRQHLDEDDPGLAMTSQPSRVDIGLMPNLEHRPTNGPREEGHIGNRDGQHRVAETRTQRGDDRECEQQIREGHEHIHAAHQQRIGEPAEEARQHADQRADQRCCHSRQHPDENARARPPDEPREQIATQGVGTQPMSWRAHRQHALRRLGQGGIGQREPGCDQRGKQDERQQAEPEERTAMAIANAAR